MSKEIIIGEGEKQNSAVHVFRIDGDHFISENSECYWISNLILGFRMEIFKDTPEGQELTKLIDCKAELPTILKYLNILVLKNSNHEKLIDLINYKIEFEKDQSYEDGRNSIRNEIKNLLFINDF